MHRFFFFMQGIAELSDMIIERLQAFRRRSNVLPKRMIVFRDGVSEVRLGRLLYFFYSHLTDPTNRVNTTK
jgi:hypothetical protein